MSADITVLFTTFNNSSELKRTLDGFLQTNRTGLRVEFVIVDNNSLDDTRVVIETFAAKIPTHYLFERKQGKCAALNRALSTIEPGKLILFTDDDVDVPTDLFIQIQACAAANTSSSVFGGRVRPVWPPVKIPDWAKALAATFRAYSQTDLGDGECLFPSDRTPVGTNWWIRREVLKKGYRFDERIGPGSGCSMGDETLFLRRLVQDGYTITYSPMVRIGHRVSVRLLKEKVMMRRALAAGSAGALLAYESEGKAAVCHHDKWRRICFRAACLVCWALRYATTYLTIGKSRQMLRRWDAMQGVGWNIEALRIVMGKSDRATLQ